MGPDTTNGADMAWEPLTLLRGVREVAALANPAAPRKVTQAAFDAARPTTGAYAGMPRAKRITEQLGLRRWSRVLAVAHEPEEKHAQLLGWKTKNEEQNWLTDEFGANLLKLVAHRRGADSLTLQLTTTRRARSSSPRTVNGGSTATNSSYRVRQIEQALGSWTAALRLAGLKTPRTRRHPGRDARAHARRAAGPLLAALRSPADEADLLAFARGNGIPYPGETRTTFGAERTSLAAKARRAEGSRCPRPRCCGTNAPTSRATWARPCPASAGESSGETSRIASPS